MTHETPEELSPRLSESQELARMAEREEEARKKIPPAARPLHGRILARAEARRVQLGLPPRGRYDVLPDVTGIRPLVAKEQTEQEESQDQ